MASLQSCFSLLILATIATQCLAQSSAPAPAPAGPVNLTAILEKGGQFTTFMRLLTATQVGSQIMNQINGSTEGMTVFAPTDNAFENLKAGTLNGLSSEEQVQLVQYHVMPKYYSFDNFETVSNPVRTQASNSDGPFGLNITSLGNNQVNVSTGVVTTQVNNALREKFPLAVYQVDKVLLPEELFGTKKAKAKAPASSPSSSDKSKGSSSKAEGPASQDSADSKNDGFGVRSMGMGVVMGIGLLTMGFLY